MRRFLWRLRYALIVKQYVGHWDWREAGDVYDNWCGSENSPLNQFKEMWCLE